MDALNIGQITQDFMGQLEEMEAKGQIPPGCVIGDVVLIVELQRPDGGSTIACRWSDPVRRHVVLGLLESAKDLAHAIEA